MLPLRSIELVDSWVVRAVPGPRVPSRIAGMAIPATVPGCVHTDLLAAGLIPDPFRDRNEDRVQWIGHTEWEYETAFDWTPGAAAERVDLAALGLDTVATVTLNGTEIGRTENMHRSYRFDARAAVRPGGNRLQVRFGSAYAYAKARRAELGFRPAGFRGGYNFIRKMACNFGWDWGPELVTAGIWRPIALEAWSLARLAEVRPLVTVAGRTGRIEVHVRLEREAAEPVVVSAAVAEAATAQVTVAPDQDAAVLRLEVSDPQLWWPRGYGEQPLYTLTVTLTDPAGRHLDAWQRQIGFRTVRLDTTPDVRGTPYTLVVNDVPVFVRGANWIPDDTFPTRVTRERYQSRLRQAADANINYLRVWGGGRYEAEEFYETADELGLLVGQDFLFACAAYPQEPPFAAEVEAEAREQVVRLAPYPSLVTWTGNNENLWGYASWGWRYRLRGRSWGDYYYFDLLPRIVAELDPTRPYWPGSPYSGRRGLPPNDPAHGTMHIWDVWNRKDYSHYRDLAPRFVAEFGYQGPPAYSTLRRWLSDEPLTKRAKGMRHHQKQPGGYRKLERGLRWHLPPPKDFDDWHYLAQINQARAIQVAIEHFRSLYGECMGAIVWQLNDCWPVTSWSAIDSDGQKKPLWYALRDVFADRLLTIQPGRGGDRPGRSAPSLRLVAVNDSGTPWHEEVEVTRRRLDGTIATKVTATIEVPARSKSSVALPAPVASATAPTAEFLVATAASGERAFWFFAEDRDIRYPAPDFDAAVQAVEGGVEVTVRARALLRDLCLFPDRLDPAADVDRALVTLLPGEQAVFSVRSAATLDPAAITRAPVLRCVNDITHRSKQR